MKSLKKIGFVVVAIAMFLGFVSCDNNATTPAEPPHEHTFSDAWTKDSTHHWHAATCEHTDKVSGKAAHTFGAWTTPTGNADKTRTCSVCGYEETEHTFSTDWSSDDTYHWHAATCTHTDEVSEKERHDWGSGTVTKQPTETDDGEKTFTCSVCKKTKTETIPAGYTGPALKGVANYRNEFQNTIKETGASSFVIKKIVFGLLSNTSVKTVIENTTVAATKKDIGTVADVYYVYYDKDNKTVYIVPADESAEKIVLNPNSISLFGDFSNCETIEGLALCDTSKVTNMAGMFLGCSKLTELDLSKFDTSKVTDMTRMFQDCQGLTKLDLSKFDTSKVTNMAEMFDCCYELTELDLSKFDTSKVTNMAGMFSGCSKLTELDLSKFNTSKVTNMAAMFYFCKELTKIYVKNEDNFVPSGCDTTNMFITCGTSKLTTKTN